MLESFLCTTLVSVRKSKNLCKNQSSGSGETCNCERNGICVGSTLECRDGGNTVDSISNIGYRGMDDTYGEVPVQVPYEGLAAPAGYVVARVVG
jgi:hypothetical protein